MSKLNIGVSKKEQRGRDTFLSLILSEKVEEDDGDKSVTLDVTLHDVMSESVVVRNGVLLETKEGAPVILNIGRPTENPLV